MLRISWTFLPDVFRVLSLGAIIGGVGVLGMLPPEDRQELPLSILLGKHQYLVRCLAFARDGKTLATAGGFLNSPGEIKLWDLPTLTERATLSGDLNGVYAIAFAHDGRTLATLSLDGMMRQWDVATRQVRACAPAPLPYSARTVLSADGRTLAQVRWDKDPTSILLMRGAPVTGNAFEGSSGPVAVGEDRQLLTLLSSLTPDEATSTLRPDQGHIWALAFSPDGRTLASGGFDGTVRLWEVDSGLEKAALRQHRDQVGAIAFSPDGRLLASGSHDATIKLWDVATGEDLATLCGHTGTITCVGFDHTGRWIASAGHDQTVRLWPVGNIQ